MEQLTRLAAYQPPGDDLGLAPLFSIRDFDGSLGEYIEALYARYHALLYEPGIELWGGPLIARDAKAADGRDLTFWHLVTSGTSVGTEETRRLDLWRCAYLPRVCDLLERLAREDIRVCWWREQSGYVMATPVDFSMVVELRRQRGAYRLITAYPTDKPRKRGRTFKRAAARWAVSQHPVMAEYGGR
jgi:hypothetical protein